jgi:APA family basic amino acid/polyamine antiporter
VAFVGYLDPFLPSIVRTPTLAAALAIGLLWFLTAVNLFGIRTAARLQIVTTVLKILPLVAIGIAGAFMFEPSHFAVAAPSGGMAKSLMAVTTLTLWAFLGLESATIPADSTADARSTIPRATIVGTLLTAAVYLTSTVGVMSLIDPVTLSRSAAPFADAARVVGGDRAAMLVALGAATSCFGALNGWILIAGQIPMAVARDGLLPRAFGRVSSRGVPAFAIVVAGVFSSLLIVTNYSKSVVDLFTFAILLATLSSLIPYAFCSLAGFILHRRDRRFEWSTGTAIVSAVAFVYSLFAIGGAGADVVYYGFLLLLAGLPVYVLTDRAATG